jgi:hypothetical protein
VTYEEVIEFRAELYRTVERKDQEDVLRNYFKAQETKRETSKNKQVNRTMAVSYYHKRSNGEKIQVCKSMFQVRLFAELFTQILHFHNI